MNLNKECEKNYISVVVYVHNDASKLPMFMDTLYGHISSKFENYEFIFVDDASTDKSPAVIKEFFKEIPDTATLMTMSFYQGMEKSMVAGVDAAVGDYVYEFDSVNITYPVTTIWDVYLSAVNGNDIVAAVPSKSRSLSSQLFYDVFNHFSDIDGKLRTEVFRIISRRAINRVYSMTATIPYRKAAYASCGLSNDYIEFTPSVKIGINDTDEKNMRRKIGIDILILYTDMGYRLAMSLACIMILFTLFCIIFIIVIYCIGNPVPGHVSTFGLASFGFFGVNSLLAVLIKYISLNLNITFKRQGL